MSLQPLLDTLTGWVSGFISMLPHIVAAVVVLVAFRILAKLVARAASAPLSRATDNGQLRQLAVTCIRVGITLAGMLVALRIVQLDGAVASALAGVGIIGLALGFAFQDIAANFVSGVILGVRRPYDLGDVIKTGDIMGTVHDVGLRATLIRNFSGQLITIPNKDLLSNPLFNYTRSGERRCDISIGISYGDDLDEAERVCLDAARQVAERDTTREPEAFYGEFADSSINLTIRIWLDAKNQNILATKHQAIKAMKRGMDRAGLTIPFPIQTLDFGIVGGEPLDEVLRPVLRAQNDAAE